MWDSSQVLTSFASKKVHFLSVRCFSPFAFGRPSKCSASIAFHTASHCAIFDSNQVLGSNESRRVHFRDVHRFPRFAFLLPVKLSVNRVLAARVFLRSEQLVLIDSANILIEFGL
jgi:hypothetical protein